MLWNTGTSSSKYMRSTSVSSVGSSPSLDERLISNSSQASSRLFSNDTVKNPTKRRRTLKETLDVYVEWTKKHGKRNIKWTLFDDRRIVSLDELHSRMRDYHVVNCPPVSIPVDFDMVEREFEIACQFVLIPSQSNRNASSSPLIKRVCFGNLLKAFADDLNVNRLKQTVDFDLVWVHVVSGSALPKVLKHFSVSHMFQLYFYDERPHSTFMSSGNELMLSLVSCRLGQREKALVNKVYIYVQNNICISFEMDPVPSFEQLQLSDSARVESIDRQAEDTVTSIVFRRFCDKVCEVKKPIELLHEIANYNLLVQTSLLDFCSIGILYFRDKLNKSQFVMVRGDLDRKVRVIESTLLLMKSFAQDAEAAVEAATLDYSYAVQEHRRRRLNPCTENQTVFANATAEELAKLILLEALLDSYSSNRGSIESELLEAVTTYEDMNDKSTITHNNTTIALAMVATVFLPLNFFTGMFGMNFQANGHYSIASLNDKNGPIYFLLLCILMTLIALIYFVANGWMNPIRSTKRAIWYIAKAPGRLYEYLTRSDDEDEGY